MKQALVVNNRHKHYHKASAQYTQLVQLKNNVVPITRKRGRPKKLSTVIKLHNYIYPNHHPQLKRQRGRPRKKHSSKTLIRINLMASKTDEIRTLDSEENSENQWEQKNESTDSLQRNYEEGPCYLETQQTESLFELREDSHRCEEQLSDECSLMDDLQQNVNQQIEDWIPVAMF